MINNAWSQSDHTMLHSLYYLFKMCRLFTSRFTYFQMVEIEAALLFISFTETIFLSFIFYWRKSKEYFSLFSLSLKTSFLRPFVSVDHSKKLIPFNEEQNIVFICETIQLFVRRKRARQVEWMKQKKVWERQIFRRETFLLLRFFLAPLLQRSSFKPVSC